MGEQERWDLRYRAQLGGQEEASLALRHYDHLLPRSGLALDLACGLGADALLLAALGLEVHAWDLSGVATARLAAVVEARGLPVHVRQRDVITAPPAPKSYDVITVRRFLARELAPALAGALRPGGLLVYETFTQARVDQSGPRSDRFRLMPGELWRLFIEGGDLHPLIYREEGLVGDTRRGQRGQALLIAQRPQDR